MSESVEWIELNAKTIKGDIPMIKRIGNTVAFCYQEIDDKSKFNARSSAVAWIAANRQKQIGVNAYRFDLINSDGAVVHKNAF